MKEYLFKISDYGDNIRYIRVEAETVKAARKKYAEISQGQGWLLYGVYREL